MSQEILIPKMKRLSNKEKKINFPVVNVVLIIFGVFLLIVSTFINIDLRHYIIPNQFWSGKHFSEEDYIFTFCIIPQIPALMFVCSMLGKKMALYSVILYILAGITLFPVFALGGGIQYITEYSFGYIMAYIPAVLIAGQFLKNKYSFLNMLLATLCGVLTIHILGFLYMIVVAIIKHDGIVFIKGWLGAQSGLKILYDIILSYVLMIIGKYINAVIKYMSD